MSRILLPAVLLLAVAVALAQRRDRPTEQDVAEGRVIYNRSCTICHGVDGTVGDRGPALAGARRYLRTTDQDLFEAIRNGLGGTQMPPAGLPEAEIWKVVAYIRSLRASAYDAFVKGDPARGEKIFWGKGRCGDCHMIRGKGGLLGPDLSNTGGQRTFRFLREALTKPRPQIPRGYQPVRVQTADGRSLTGIIKNENNFSLQLLDAGNKLHLFTRDELREVVYEKQSLMPANYDRLLAPAELQDLLAFLSRQAAQKIRQERMRDEDLAR